MAGAQNIERFNNKVSGENRFNKGRGLSLVPQKRGFQWRGALPRETGNAQFPHDGKKAGIPSTRGVQRGVQRGNELQ